MQCNNLYVFDGMFKSLLRKAYTCRLIVVYIKFVVATCKMR